MLYNFVNAMSKTVHTRRYHEKTFGLRTLPRNLFAAAGRATKLKSIIEFAMEMSRNWGVSLCSAI